MNMMKPLRCPQLVVVLAAGLAMLLAACSGAAPTDTEAEAATDATSSDATSAPAPTAESTSGGTLVVAQGFDAQPESFLSPAIGNIVSQYAVFETLTLINIETGEPEGVLAESWEMAPDLLSMEIQLQDDVTFHTGRPMTSADVLYTIEQVQNPDNPVGSRFIAEQITGAQADGDLGVTLTFAQPLPNVFDLFEIMPIIDEETFADYEGGEQVVGTGRFVWESWTPGGTIVLQKYADHRDADATPLDTIEIEVISDSTAALAAVRSGRAHYAVSLNPLDARTLGEEAGYELVQTGGSSIALGFDVTRPPADNQTLRQAVHYAIDRERIIDQVQGGLAEATALPWKTSTLGYDVAQGSVYSYDPDRAAELVAEAGAEGASFNLVVPDIPESVAVFEIIQNNLAAVGLNAEGEIVSTADYDERIANRDLGAPAFLMRNGNAFSPASAVVSRPELLPEGNLSQFDTPEYAEVVDAVTTALTPEETEAALAAYNEYFLDQAFALTLIVRPTLTVRVAEFDGISPTIQGFLNVSTGYLTEQ